MRGERIGDVLDEQRMNGIDVGKKRGQVVIEHEYLVDRAHFHVFNGVDFFRREETRVEHVGVRVLQVVNRTRVHDVFGPETCAVLALDEQRVLRGGDDRCRRRRCRRR